MLRTSRRRLLGGMAALAASTSFSPRLARASVVVPPPSGSAATDQSNIQSAIASAASSSQGVVFPDGATYQLVSPIFIGDGYPVPAFIVGYSTTLRATSAMLNMDSIFKITNPHAVVPRFELGGFILDAANYPYRCMTVHGMQECNGYIHDLTLFNAQSIGLALDAEIGYGIYENYFQRIRIRGCGWVGARFNMADLTDYNNNGSRCQANDISGLNIESCAGGGILCAGFQGSIRHSQIQANGNVGLYASNSRQLDLIELYFENNIPTGGVDTAVQIDGSTVVDDGCRRYGGRWNGAVIGPVTRF